MHLKLASENHPMRFEYVPILNATSALIAIVFACWVLGDILSQVHKYLELAIRRRRKQKHLNTIWDKLVKRLLECPEANRPQSEILRFVAMQRDYVIDGYFHALEAVEESCGNPQVKAFAQTMGWLYYEHVLALHFIADGRSCGVSPTHAIHSDITARCKLTDFHTDPTEMENLSF